ncbi:MAG: hypothetical protein KatS3mg035_2290 [Bacteroidia bacterium]|nr:MAG: hypothetical protein KatS3mg035_2290 [Bacteroidia bacterium]
MNKFETEIRMSLDTKGDTTISVFCPPIIKKVKNNHLQVKIECKKGIERPFWGPIII